VDIPEMAAVSVDAFVNDLSSRIATPDPKAAKRHLRKRFEEVFDHPLLWVWKAVEVSVGQKGDGLTPIGNNQELQGGGEEDRIVGVAIWATAYPGRSIPSQSQSDFHELKPPMGRFMAAGLLLPSLPLSNDTFNPFSPARDKVELPSSDYLNAVHGYIDSVQKQWIDNKNVLYLAGLSVLPTSQGQGVGSALLKVGMDRADKEGICSWLEASPAGYPVYLHRGWRVVDTKDFDLSRWGGEDRGYGMYRFRAMLRLPVPANQAV